MRFCNPLKNETSISSTSSLFSEIWKNDQIRLIFMVGGSCHIVSAIAVVILIIRKKSGPPSSFSLFHVLLFATMSLLTFFLKEMKDGHLVQIQDPLTCRLWGYLMTNLFFSIQTSSVATFYEIVHSSRISQQPKLKVKMYLILWISGAILSFPAIGTYKIKEENVGVLLDPCQKAYILDSSLVHSMYETFLMFTIAVPPIYMGWTLGRLHFKLKYLRICKPIPSTLKKKVRKIRLAFFYLVCITVSWSIPICIRGLRKIFGSLDMRDRCYRFSDGRTDWETLSWKIYMAIHIALYPLLFLQAHDQLRFLGQVSKSGQVIVRYVVACHGGGVRYRQRSSESSVYG